MIYIIIVLSAIIGGGVIASGGGGGSGKSNSGGVVINSNSSWNSNSNRGLINKYQTKEYKKQWGLESIKASEAYALLEQNNKNIAGDGVKIGIADSGVRSDHVDINDNFSSLGSSPTTDNNGHGTNVASIAAGVKNISGIHGVAFNSGILSVNVFDDQETGYGVSWLANAGTKVVNMSFAIVDGNKNEVFADIGSSLYKAYKLDLKSEFNSARNSDVFVAIAAGNGGNSNYVSIPAVFVQDEIAGGNMIAVAAMDQSNNLADFSNRCKQVKEFCLVAPGVNIYGAWNINSTSYVLASGTSQASPHVAGAAAILRGAWPYLSASQVTQILLNSATDLGVVGVDDIYGHGLLNLEAAVQAQGKNNIVATNYINGSGYDARLSKLMTSGIFGDSYQANIAPFLKRAVFFDDFGRDYNANLDQKILTPSSRYNLDNYLFNYYSFKETPIYSGNNSILKMGLAGNFLENNFFLNNNRVDQFGLRYRTLDNSKENPLFSNLDKLSFSYSKNLNDYSKISFVTNSKAISFDETNPINQFGFISDSAFAPYHFSQDNNWFRNNNLKSALANNHRILINNNFNKNLSVNFAYSSYDHNAIDSGGNFNNFVASKSRIFDGILNYQLSDHLKLGFAYGILKEDKNSFLASKAQGAFSVGNSPDTNYFQINGTRKIIDNLYLLASYSLGKTNLSGNDLGIFRNFSDVRSKAFAIGLMTDDFFGAKLGFIYSEPLRVYKGSVDVDIPVARNLQGEVSRLSLNDLSLKPTGQEQNLEIFYQKILSNQASASFNFLIRQQPGNIRDSSSEYLWFTKYVLKF